MNHQNYWTEWCGLMSTQSAPQPVLQGDLHPVVEAVVLDGPDGAEDGWWPPGMTERCPTVLVLITVKSHSSILLDRMLWAASLDWSPLHKLPSLGLNKNNLPLCCFLTLKLYFELFYCQLDWRFELWPYQIWVGYGVWLAVEQGPTTIIFNHNPTLKTSKTVENITHILSQIIPTYFLR